MRGCSARDLLPQHRRDLRAEQLDRTLDVRVRERADARLRKEPVMSEELAPVKEVEVEPVGSEPAEAPLACARRSSAALC